MTWDRITADSYNCYEDKHVFTADCWRLCFDLLMPLYRTFRGGSAGGNTVLEDFLSSCWEPLGVLGKDPLGVPGPQFRNLTGCNQLTDPGDPDAPEWKRRQFWGLLSVGGVFSLNVRGGERERERERESFQMCEWVWSEISLWLNTTMLTAASSPRLVFFSPLTRHVGGGDCLTNDSGHTTASQVAILFKSCSKFREMFLTSLPSLLSFL